MNCHNKAQIACNMDTFDAARDVIEKKDIRKSD